MLLYLPTCLFLLLVLRGRVQAIENSDGGYKDDDEDHASLMVSSSHVYRQKKRVFVPSAGGTRGRGRWTGQVKVLQKCNLGAGQGEEFLLTGSVRFGEAWLGCALRYKDFLRIYHTAMRAGSNPCHIDTDWPHTSHTPLPHTHSVDIQTQNRIPLPPLGKSLCPSFVYLYPDWICSIFYKYNQTSVFLYMNRPTGNFTITQCTFRGIIQPFSLNADKTEILLERMLLFLATLSHF